MTDPRDAVVQADGDRFGWHAVPSVASCAWLYRIPRPLDVLGMRHALRRASLAAAIALIWGDDPKTHRALRCRPAGGWITRSGWALSMGSVNLRDEPCYRMCPGSQPRVAASGAAEAVCDLPNVPVAYMTWERGRPSIGRAESVDAAEPAVPVIADW